MGGMHFRDPPQSRLRRKASLEALREQIRNLEETVG